MAERTSEQILDEVVYAVACATYHYGPSFSADGLIQLRKVLSEMGDWRTDSTYSLDCLEDEPYIDFHERIVWPEGWWLLDFDDIASKSRGERGQD